MEGEESIQKKIYMQLVVFLFGYLRQETGYQEEDKSAQGICCYADEILQQMAACCQKGSSQQFFLLYPPVNQDGQYLLHMTSYSAYLYNPEPHSALSYGTVYLYVLGGKNLIERYMFNQWIDDAMKCGLNRSIKRKREMGDEREYEITWLLDDVFYQGFQILWEDESGNRNINCFRIEGAMLFSKDKLFRMKGLNAVRAENNIFSLKTF